MKFYSTLLLTLLAFMVSSCESFQFIDEDEEPSDGYKVTFNLGEFTISDFGEQGSASAKGMKAASRRSKEAKELGTVLNFAVFQGDTKVASVSQKSTDESFGTVTLTLGAGDYQVVALVHSCSGNATITSVEKITFPNNRVTDTFSAYREIEVSGDDSMDLTLDRCVSMFRLVVEDAIPDDVAQMKFYYTGGSSTFDATTGFGCVNSRQTEYREVSNHAAGQVFEVYTFPHDPTDALNMTITAQDSKDNTIAEHAYENVPIEVNKVTTHKGVFFTGGSAAQGASFVLRGNSEWAGEISF